MELSSRMKEYENTFKTKLMIRTPIIIRLDGKAFHSYTSTLKDKFDSELMSLMIFTMKYLVDNLQNAKLGYTQSDEISILLVDTETYDTQQTLGGIKSKLESISASMCTAFFNSMKVEQEILKSVKQTFALFDSRAFNLPKDEVANYFIWRQQDATRNSINVLGQSYYSQKQLNGLSTNQIQDLLFKEKNINWNDLEDWKKRGTFYRIKDKPCFSYPILTQDRDFIETLLKD